MKPLCKGIFWIIDMENIDENSLIFPIPVNFLGTIDDSVDRRKLNSKNHDNYNHEKTWKSLDYRATRNKRFDFYPRGRVEIRNRKATIYASPYICEEDVMEWIIENFGLTKENGIQKIRIIPDNSSHYRCHLDRTW